MSESKARVVSIEKEGLGIYFGLQLKTSSLEETGNRIGETKADEILEDAAAQNIALKTTDEPKTDDLPKTGEVITLDAFRKKRP